ncbi:MAG: dihydroorotate dehydrogenase electron transfer subunit [Oscillospiraceae bacterium]
MYTQGLCYVTDVKNLSENIFTIFIKSEGIAKDAFPGQFLHIKIDNHILRRPISLSYVDKISGILRFDFLVVGDGTRKLAETKKGDFLDVIGPIGKGFTFLDKSKKVVLVGGSLGVAPLLPLANYYKNNSFSVLGFRNDKQICLVNDFKLEKSNVIVTTDDGSFGIKGNVIDSLENILKNNHIDMVYTCGPYNMMKSVFKTAKNHNVNCEVSLEEKMGCGIGACLVCASKIRKNDNLNMLHICKDGPVFKGEEAFYNE